MPLPPRPVDLIEQTVQAGGRELTILRPRDGEALIDEQAFAHDEYLPYWTELWPSGAALAGALASTPPGAGTRVLELGCGLGVAAIVAALDGAEVTATDWSPEAVRTAAENARRNGARVDVRLWDWSARPPEDAPWPLVIAADVLYERRYVPQVLAVLGAVVAGGGEAWIADPGRPPVDEFLAEAEAAGWALDSVPHDGPAFVTVHRLRRGAKWGH